jgi:alginate O-acetyltransferase complex protein AlgI
VNNIFFLIFAVIACTNLGKEIKKRALEVGKVHNNVFMACNIFDMVIPALLVIVSAVALAGDSYNPFLYFQF